MSETENTPLELATFGAGCFWGVEATFRQLEGVRKTEVGYCGGHTQAPTYQEVCTGETGHAEVVQVSFDPSVISYEDLLETFFGCHDPTTLNRQGPDVGSQYRSVIFTHSAEQAELAEAAIAELNEAERFPRPIVTAVQPFEEFYPAEDYHQQYFEKRGLVGGCH